jgi:predicted cupin superfamily sugar epimerase
VSCIVAPGFEFDGFELASPGWEPQDQAEQQDPKTATTGDQKC